MNSLENWTCIKCGRLIERWYLVDTWLGRGPQHMGYCPGFGVFGGGVNPSPLEPLDEEWPKKHYVTDDAFGQSITDENGKITHIFPHGWTDEEVAAYKERLHTRLVDPEVPTKLVP